MRRAGLTVLLLLCATLSPACAQSTSTTTTQPQVTPTDASVRVKLGDSSTDLTGAWMFHTGDDLAWAQPSFDDSAWTPVDLTLQPGSAKAAGWTTRGYPGYSGFAWYRIRANTEGATHRLALEMPDADDAYQVYVNGQLIGELGKFTGHSVTAYPALPEGYPLPKEIRNGTITIAIRMWMDPATLFNSRDAGGLRGPPSLGYNSSIMERIRLDYAEIAQYFSSGFVEVMILIMALLMAAALFWLDRQEQAYVWLAIVCLATLLENGIVLSVNFTAWLGQTTAVVLSQVILGNAVRIGLWVMFWGYWFRIAHIDRLHKIVWSLVAVLALGTAMLRAPLYGEIVPVHYASFINPILLVVKLGLGVLLFLVAYRGFTTQKTEGWMAGTAVLLGFIANYQAEINLIHVPITYSIFGFNLSLGAAATITSLLLITIMQLRRFIMAQVLKEQWKMEIQQAQEVQQLLIPAEVPEVNGITIESEYRPAREVGGDFFQILPLETPGTVLIVVGDVTGKGMQAGMLVALIVGAIRGAVVHSTDPAQILREVNEQLCERQHAIATCLILRIDPDGTGIIANAGQLSPYLNGKEIEMEGAFPIGIVPDGDFSMASFALKDGDNLFMMSDGVVEATDPQGTLFGFERISELLDRRATSAEIAVAAQQFGQEDDILVVQVRRNAQQPIEANA